MQRTDFSFALPDHLIARHPLTERSASRLLLLDGRSGRREDQLFQALPQLLRAGDLLIFNDTRVIPARLFGHKVATGGRVEVLIERLCGECEAWVQLRSSKSPAAGSELRLAEAFTVQVMGREGDLFRLRFPSAVLPLLNQYGELPLPPYIGRTPDAIDAERYQTLYSRHPGAVAAPTAGLHFDEPLLAALDAAGIGRAYVTLHVGAGTFQPVRVDDIRHHQMHHEAITLPAATCDAIAATRAAGGRVIAVGTTVVRTLESVAAIHQGALTPYSGDTAIFIYPGYRFAVIDGLITNFHLPESTLLMLVSAFAGRESVLDAYRHAVANAYRFFSYGDAMLLWPAAASR